MKFLTRISLFLLTCATISLADIDLYFKNSDDPSQECVFKPFINKCMVNNATRGATVNNNGEVRMRFIDPPRSSAAEFGFYLDKPFFIIDGIHLSTTEERTLSKFQNEADEFGMTQMLKALGYTPVLVQFSETVRQSLQNNSRFFANALKYLNSNNCIPFPNKIQDGFIVMGISQGGIIGRYGSYLYSTEKDDRDAPIKFFASLDSPHQGAVMPRGLISTLDFWANKADEPAATAFYDLITGPGAQDLLIYDTGKGNHDPKTGSDRFLFGDYRKAAEYKGFPAVLIAQGQLKGEDPKHNSKYYELNREASFHGKTVGRAESNLSYSSSKTEKYSHNHKYEVTHNAVDQEVKGESSYDFVQGSTYPFAKTLYESLRTGFLSAIPDNMKQKIQPLGISLGTVSLSTKWKNDSLYQPNSTFIPTVSAMDMKCNGNLGILTDCAHSHNSNFPYENPNNESSGIAAYAVDPTHPRYSEPISGRHIESPMKQNEIDTIVLKGMQVDIWRILCELAKVDYNKSRDSFNNPALNVFFSPNTKCMDISKIPSIIKNSGMNQVKKFAYVRYDFIPKATEVSDIVRFDIPAGWQKTVIIDNGEKIPAGSIFEVDVAAENNRSNWMKAELLMTATRQGAMQLQLSEQNVNFNGDFHTLRWVIPPSLGTSHHYRWFRLVFNSEGTHVAVSHPRLITSAISIEKSPDTIKSPLIYPNSSYPLVPWNNSTTIQEKGTNDNQTMQIKTTSKVGGIHINLGSTYSLEKFKELKVVFEPGTCQKTMVYFDSKMPSEGNLVKYTLQNDIAYKILPLEKIIDTNTTPNRTLSASRLVLQPTDDNESCFIRAITLQ